MKNQLLLLLLSPVASSHQEKLIEGTELQWMHAGGWGWSGGGGLSPLTYVNDSHFYRHQLPGCLIVWSLRLCLVPVPDTYGGANGAQEQGLPSVDGVLNYAKSC